MVHFVIVQMARSELLSALHRAVFVWQRSQRTAPIRPSESAKAAAKAHRRIFETIAARDPDAAENAMSKHLDEVERYYWATEVGSARRPRANEQSHGRMR